MLAPSAITPVVTPAKYRWWNMPSTPPAMNTIVANSALNVADLPPTRRSLTKMKLTHADANTSQKPSTHRCTIQQRHQVTIAIVGASRHHQPDPDRRPLATVDRKTPQANRTAALTQFP